MATQKVKGIPKEFPVQPLSGLSGAKVEKKATCGHCGLSWDDGKATSMTPAPGGRCPFESFHIYREGKSPAESAEAFQKKNRKAIALRLLSCAMADIDTARAEMVDAGRRKSAQKFERLYVRMDALRVEVESFK